MATPIGHLLGGLAVSYALPSRDERRVALAVGCALIAVAPDLDFLPGILVGRPALYHQGLSHSLGATLIAGVLGGLALRRRLGSFLTGFLAAALAYLSHPVIDLFGPDGRLPYGIPILWPFSSAYFHAPFSLFLGVHHADETSSGLGTWLCNIFSFRNVLSIAVEVAVVGPLVGIAHLARRRRSGNTRTG